MEFVAVPWWSPKTSENPGNHRGIFNGSVQSRKNSSPFKVVTQLSQGDVMVRMYAPRFLVGDPPYTQLCSSLKPLKRTIASYA